MDHLTPTNFPPSFQESPFAYGSSLFGLSLISAISIGIFMTIILEPRHRRRIDEAVGNMINQPHAIRTWSALGIYRVKILALLLTLVFGCLPDVLFLLAWGEATDRMIIFLFAFDRIMDGVALIPFLVFVATYFMSGGVITHQLALHPKEITSVASWTIFRQHLKTALLVLFISAGVTVYKAHL